MKYAATIYKICAVVCVMIIKCNLNLNLMWLFLKYSLFENS